MNISRFRDEWHPTKNLPLVFISTLPKSGKYWWLGKECGHEWKATLNKRLGKNSGCLVCSSLALVNPALASEWHPTKNGELTPVAVGAEASGKYWWQCEKDHEWEDYLHERVKGRGCFICSGKTLLVGFNDLVTLFPSVAAEWHPTKNGDSSPEQFLVNSSAKVWWLCSENHEWEDSVKSFAVKSLGCPYCANRKFLGGFNDFATVNPSVVAEWHPTKNGDQTPDQFITVSSIKVWWLCSENHEWEVALGGRSKGSGCPYCANRALLVGFNDLATVNPSLASEWHPTKNGELAPEDVTARSSSRVWWVGKCGHEWEAAIGSRTSGSSNCPVCEHPESYDKELIVGTNDFASVEPEIASQWHPTKNGELTPDSIVRMFNGKVWWIGACGNEWEATPKSRKTAACPDCTSSRVQFGVNDLVSVDPAIAAEWHPTKNSPLTLRHISVGSEKKVWWLCSENHEWEALVKNRASKKIGCPECSGRKKINGRKFMGRNLVLGVNDLATASPEIASEWHPTKNGDLTPQQVTDVSHKKVWWLGACGHEWEYEVRHRVNKGYGCRFCK